MDDVIIINNDESENSIIEVEIPKKPTPPLIEIDDEDFILNIVQEKKNLFLAKNFINKDKGFLEMTHLAGSSHSTKCPNHWTSDMIKFYDDDWGDEDQFTVEKLQEKMDKSPSLWQVSRKDLLLGQGNIRKNYMKCWNCGQRGHHFSLCPEEEYVLKCHMCGNSGHTHYSCPNSKCLNCGAYSKEYVTCCFKCRSQENQICPRCQLIGHTFFNCTDHWRMFHSTTKGTSVQVPEKLIMKSDKNIWCCNCGKKGHHLIQCWHKRDLFAFKDTFPFVASYQKAFEYSQPVAKSNEIPWRKNKRKRSTRSDPEKTLKINPMHKAIIKNTVQFKKKIKKMKKKKRTSSKKKKKKAARDGLLQAVC